MIQPAWAPAAADAAIALLVTVVLVALVAARLWRLIALDTVLDVPRDWLIVHTPGWVDVWLSCPWCSGTWIAIAVGLLVTGFTWGGLLVGVAASMLVGWFADR